MVADVFYVHLTISDARPAVIAPVYIDLYADYRQLVEHSVNRTERTYKPAEEAVHKYAAQSDYEHYHEFSCEQNVQYAEQVGVVRICEHSHCALKSSRGADIFAEAGNRHAVGYPVP